ncbi:hypothetical protein M427DRAFT_130943 [Gonapodya prolifera JEL478]|uniref:Uncharacterized protein n=1 Tax=Gonapodya prolifera (strain JEL478) TaxID=1344416 RepID=A0A139AVF4_GONPJ|nr:hypothetical protein M427DRAFT_130943 [Gonapodya prolifera JEL478]|eukprot:KXS20712.1 hypothetical protein M427DRAFT_130943 [Gonapodya prolifera JEL478]
MEEGMDDLGETSPPMETVVGLPPREGVGGTLAGSGGVAAGVSALTTESALGLLVGDISPPAFPTSLVSPASANLTPADIRWGLCAAGRWAAPVTSSIAADSPTVAARRCSDPTLRMPSWSAERYANGLGAPPCPGFDAGASPSALLARFPDGPCTSSALDAVESLLGKPMVELGLELAGDIPELDDTDECPDAPESRVDSTSVVLPSDADEMRSCPVPLPVPLPIPNRLSERRSSFPALVPRLHRLDFFPSPSPPISPSTMECLVLCTTPSDSSSSSPSPLQLLVATSRIIFLSIHDRLSPLSEYSSSPLKGRPAPAHPDSSSSPTNLGSLWADNSSTSCSESHSRVSTQCATNTAIWSPSISFSPSSTVPEIGPPLPFLPAPGIARRRA